MTEINLIVPNWILWVISIYLIVMAVVSIVQVHYKRKEVQLKYWKHN